MIHFYLKSSNRDKLQQRQKSTACLSVEWIILNKLEMTGGWKWSSSSGQNMDLKDAAYAALQLEHDENEDTLT